MWCKRCSCEIGMLEAGCTSCDHGTDWVEGDKPEGFKALGLRSPLETMFNTKYRQAIFEARPRRRLTVPWRTLLVVAVGCLLAAV